MNGEPRISVVCPLLNEEGNVASVVEAVRRALASEGSWELVLVDDGSEDDTALLARRAAARDPRVRLVRLARNYGQATATQAGFDHVRGRVVVTMDGDLQNDPADIPRLVETLERGGYDLVSGYRETRHDRFITRTLPSRVANILIRALTGVRIRDNGCSLKAYRRAAIERIGLYSDMHRFIPALAVGTFGARVAEIPVRHHRRRHGRSKYGLSRVWKVLADLLVVIMIRWFRDRPLYMFAVGALFWLTVAAACFGGALATSWLGPRGPDSIVLPGAGVVFVGLSLYLLMLGLIAEVALGRPAGTASAGEPIPRPGRAG